MVSLYYYKKKVNYCRLFEGSLTVSAFQPSNHTARYLSFNSVCSKAKDKHKSEFIIQLFEIEKS